MVAKPKLGESAEVLADREQSARVEANIIIGAARADWEKMRATLAGKPAKEGVK